LKNGFNSIFELPNLDNFSGYFRLLSRAPNYDDYRSSLPDWHQLVWKEAVPGSAKPNSIFNRNLKL
jgi:hypothetical protein